MINPGPSDIGRRVIYVPGHAHGSQAHPDCERGVITSYNTSYVFVRYGDQPNPKATLREDLHFAPPDPHPGARGGTRKDRMSWHRRTPLSFDDEHTHHTHTRWYPTHRTERRITHDEQWDRIHARAEELVPGEEPEEKAYQRAVDIAYAEQGYPDWIENQCGGCRFYINLEGGLGMDWGACTNPASPYDGTLKFEHDGCEHFGVDDGPITADYVSWCRVGVDCAKRELEEAEAEFKGTDA